MFIFPFLCGLPLSRRWSRRITGQELVEVLAADQPAAPGFHGSELPGAEKIVDQFAADAQRRGDLIGAERQPWFTAAAGRDVGVGHLFLRSAWLGFGLPGLGGLVAAAWPDDRAQGRPVGI